MNDKTNTILLKIRGILTMLPEEIISIINKYIQDDSKFIIDLNKNITNISMILKAINGVIANQIQELLTNIDSDVDESELLQDAKTLKYFIKTIETIGISTHDEQYTKNGQISTEEILKELSPTPLFDKKVYPYLVDDDICPFCNVKLKSYTIYYQRFENNRVNGEQVQWYKCPNCNKMFAVDYDITDFDFENTNIILNKSKYDEIPQIDIYSVIILSNILNCTFNHKTKDIFAKLPVLNEDGQISYLKVNASYCFNCNRFTILKEDFLAIKDVVICKVIDETTTGTQSESEFNMTDKDSVLTQYGYNVQTKKNLSKQQRQIILSSLIEANIMNRTDVINHLITLIERGSKIPSWKDATNKWKEDKVFVAEYQKDCLPEVVFNNIILKYRKKS